NTREQKFSKAKTAGEHGIADGRVLGYKNVGEHKRRQRVIDPEQAKLVVRIFEMSASGMGYLKIARTLNHERVKNPNGQEGGNTVKRSHQWSVGGIKSILERELYRGRLVYGKKRNVWTDEGRHKVAGDSPVTTERPDLRVVPESLWTAAHTRRRRAVRQHERTGSLYGKPGAGLGGKDIFSSLLQCGPCGGNMYISPKMGRRQTKPQIVYACSNRKNGRGLEDGSPCPNVYGIDEHELTSAVLEAIKSEFLDEERLGRLFALEYERRRQEPNTIKADRAAARTLVAKLEGEVERLVDAVAGGGGAVRALGARLPGDD